MINYKNTANALKIAAITKKKQLKILKIKNSLKFLKILLNNHIILNFWCEGRYIKIILNESLLKKIKFVFLNKKLNHNKLKQENINSNSIFFFLTNTGVVALSNSNNVNKLGGFLFLRIDF